MRHVGIETLLVVEDDENLRSLLLNLFKPCGFTVLAAPTAEDALGLSARHPGPIHLLIADVVLPRLGGPDLAKRLREERPGLQTLFISGYNAEAIARSGPLPLGAPFLQKPFTPTTILRLVRNILDR